MDRDYVLTAQFRPIAYTFDFAPPFSSTNLLAAPWATSGDQPWLLAAGAGPAGGYALRSGPISDSQQSLVQLGVSTRAGAASFDFRVSSEQGWDFLEFYLDGFLVERWSGDQPWQTYQFQVSAGGHLLVWRYVKDPNFSAGQDAAWISNLYLPLAAPDPREAAARLTLLPLPTGDLRIKLEGRAGLTYVLQASDDLSTWTGVATNQTASGTVFFVDPQAPSATPRYYRAVTQP